MPLRTTRAEGSDAAQRTSRSIFHRLPWGGERPAPSGPGSTVRRGPQGVALGYPISPRCGGDCDLPRRRPAGTPRSHRREEMDLHNQSHPTNPTPRRGPMRQPRATPWFRGDPTSSALKGRHPNAPSNDPCGGTRCRPTYVAVQPPSPAVGWGTSGPFRAGIHGAPGSPRRCLGLSHFAALRRGLRPAPKAPRRNAPLTSSSNGPSPSHSPGTSRPLPPSPGSPPGYRSRHRRTPAPRCRASTSPGSGPPDRSRAPGS
jgi:hypothetical protein